MLHASGFGAALFRPIQQWCHSTAVGWPSLVTAVLLYLTAICCFEFCWRLLKNTHP